MYIYIYECTKRYWKILVCINMNMCIHVIIYLHVQQDVETTIFQLTPNLPADLPRFSNKSSGSSEILRAIRCARGGFFGCYLFGRCFVASVFACGHRVAKTTEGKKGRKGEEDSVSWAFQMAEKTVRWWKFDNDNKVMLSWFQIHMNLKNKIHFSEFGFDTHTW